MLSLLSLTSAYATPVMTCPPIPEPVLTQQVLSHDQIGQTFVADAATYEIMGFFISEMNSLSPSTRIMLQLYHGEGVAPASRIHTVSAEVPDFFRFEGWVDFDTSAVSLTVGDTYTARLRAQDARWGVDSADGDTYAGGSKFSAGVFIPSDLCFRALESTPIDDDWDGYPLEFDCDDGDRAIHPAAVESCDGVDENCDGIVDEPCVLDVAAPVPGLAGVINDFVVTSAAPGATVTVTIGQRGAKELPCGVALSIRGGSSAQTIGTAVADALGTAVVSGLVPPSVLGVERVVQAGDVAACELSGAILHTF